MSNVKFSSTVHTNIATGGERSSRGHRAGEVHRLVLQPHRQDAHGGQVGDTKL